MAVAIPVSQLQLLVPVFAGVCFLKERVPPVAVLGVFFMLAGAVCLSLRDDAAEASGGANETAAAAPPPPPRLSSLAFVALVIAVSLCTGVGQTLYAVASRSEPVRGVLSSVSTGK